MRNRKRKSIGIGWLVIMLVFSLVSPVLAMAEEPSSVLEHGFEDGSTAGWQNRGDAQVSVSAEDAYAGDASLLTTGRTDGWHGPALNLTQTLEAGAVYRISAYVKLQAGHEPSNLKFTVQRDGGQYDQVNNPVPVTSDEWVKVEGEYRFDAANELIIYLESDAADAEYFMDEFAIVLLQAAPERSDVADGPDIELSGIEFDFEDGTAQGWSARIGGESVEVTDADAQEGDYSILVTGRQNPYDGAMIDVTDVIVDGARYELRVWVKLAPGEDAADVRLSVQRDASGVSSYDTVVGNTLVTADEWVELRGTYMLGQAVDRITVYVETDSSLTGFYVDHFALEPVAARRVREVQTDIPSLHEQYSDAFAIGTAFNPFQTEGDHAELVLKHFNSIVAENAMKPGPLQPEEGAFRWEDADRLADFAREHGLDLRFHTLVWHSQAAEWMFLDENGELMEATEENKELLLERMETHIRTVVERYKDVVRDWDVVNEVIDPGEPDGLRRSMWYEITGTEYIKRAFEVTREVAGPDARLYINDYNTHDPVKRDFLFELVQELRAEGVPIDGVGHQTHINIRYPSIELMRESIEMFAEVGLDNQITEMDVSIYTNDSDRYDAVPEDILIEHAYRYKDVFDMFVELQDVISNVTLWGTDDGNTWLSTFPVTRLQAPLLFDEYLQAKPAYWALVDPSQLPPRPEQEEVVIQRAEAMRGTPVIDGEVDAVWDEAQELTTDIWVSGETGATAVVKTLWDDHNLYVLAHVFDEQLSDVSENEWEQDSLEIFVDQNNAKSNQYQADDGQYRVNYHNEQSYRGDAASPETFTTATRIVDDGYIVEAAIALDPAYAVEGHVIGFDVQVNDDQDGDGVRDSVAIWNDPSGQSFQDTSRIGELELVGSAAIGDEPSESGEPDPKPASESEPEPDAATEDESADDRSTGSVYIVQPGDTLSHIALEYGTTWQELQRINNLNNPHLIFPDQEIVLPE